VECAQPTSSCVLVGERTERRRKKHNNKEQTRMLSIEQVLDKLHEAQFTCYTYEDEWNFYRKEKQVRVLWNQATAVENRKKTVLEFFVGNQLVDVFEAFAQSSNVGAEQFLHKVLHSRYNTDTKHR
jgi:tellurite resistance protein